jgi:hypothetical protein
MWSLNRLQLNICPISHQRPETVPFMAGTICILYPGSKISFGMYEIFGKISLESDNLPILFLQLVMAVEPEKEKVSHDIQSQRGHGAGNGGENRKRGRQIL